MNDGLSPPRLGPFRVPRAPGRWAVPPGPRSAGLGHIICIRLAKGLIFMPYKSFECKCIDRCPSLFEGQSCSTSNPTSQKSQPQIIPLCSHADDSPKPEGGSPTADG